MEQGLDVDRLAEQVGLDRDDVVELIEDFCDTSHTTFAELVAALEAKDLAVAARAVHTIRGGAATVGLDEIAELAAGLESELRRRMRDGIEAAAGDGVDERVQALHNCVAQVRTDFAQRSP